MPYDPESVAIDAPTGVPAVRASVVVLLIEAEGEVARWISSILAGLPGDACRFEWLTQLSLATERLERGDVDVVLIGRSLSPERNYGQALDRIRQATDDALILPLTGIGFGARGVRDDDNRIDSGTRDARWERRWLSDTLRYVGERKAVMVALRDADEILFMAKERAQVTLNSIGDAVLVTDIEGNITYLNPIAETLTGWTGVDAAGRSLSEVFVIIDGASRVPAANPAQRAIAADEPVELAANCVLLCRDGTELGIEDSAAPIHDREGGVTGAVIVFRDVSQSRAVIRRMAHLARHDALTGLANRMVLEERLAEALRMAARDGHKVGLLFVDVDHFKAINDSMGHDAGDQVLCAITERLTSCMGITDTLSRQGGDEFVVLLIRINTRQEAVQFADALARAVDQQPLNVEGCELDVSVSVGVGVYPDDGKDRQAIMCHADADMYRTRDGGGKRCAPSSVEVSGETATLRPLVRNQRSL
ncbi:MAG: diguanylate cyclase domain-containing protein [Pseudomonadota bacterium]